MSIHDTVALQKVYDCKSVKQAPQYMQVIHILNKSNLSVSAVSKFEYAWYYVNRYPDEIYYDRFLKILSTKHRTF